jgi:AcrR family transcriptional regulator
MTSARKTVPASRRRLPTEERERSIVDAALLFFSTHGLAADTRGLAEQLNISQGLIFRYFPTKASLLERVFERIELAEWHPIWEGILQDRSKPLQERLVEFYESFLDKADHPAWLRIIMYSSLGGSDVTLRYFEDHFKKIVDIIAVELRLERGHGDNRSAVSAAERETVFLLHGSIYYYLIRRHISRISPEPRSASWVRDRVAEFMRGAARGPADGDADRIQTPA